MRSILSSCEESLNDILLNGVLAFFPSTYQQVNETNGFIYSSGTLFGTTSCDMNGDGYIDVIIEVSGTTYIMFGPIKQFNTPPNNTNSIVLPILINNLIPVCGDINNDGYPDLAICSMNPSSGTLYVIYGDKNLSPGTIDNTYFDGVRGFYYKGEAGTTQALGYIRQIGDINGDGISDLIFGSSIGATGSTGTGVTYVIYGLQSGKYSSTNGILDLASYVNGVNGFSISSNQWSLILGDINNDGILDMMGDIGHTYLQIVYGSKSFSVSGSVYTPSFDGQDGFKITFPGYSILTSGNAANSVGDFNGDGKNDISLSFKGGSINYVYLIYGVDSFPAQFNAISYLNESSKGSILSMGSSYNLCLNAILKDINGDGLDDLTCAGNNVWSVFGAYSLPLTMSVTPSTINQCNGFILNTFSHFTYGDFNNDGILDILSYYLPNMYGMYGSKYYSISIDNQNTTLNYSPEHNYKVFNNFTFQDVGPCPILRIKLKVSEASINDILYLNEPNNNHYNYVRLSSSEIIVYSNDSISAPIGDLLPFVSLNSTTNTSITIIGEALGSQQPFYINIKDEASSTTTTTTTTDISTTSTSTTTTSTTGGTPTTDGGSTTTTTTTNGGSTTVGSTTGITMTTTGISNNSSDKDDKDSKRNVGVIIGPIIGGVVLISIIIFVVLYKRKSQPKKVVSQQSQHDLSMVKIYSGGQVQEIDKF
ncbi:tenascin X [Heterostelium album PN500]|uniref:Tenascin X n=1 Tax=Heterostelium pallidum (strain ATCC 26659 / Pp 5 / PN500) TaxID=670386 RepID=D3BVE0_HETP5|nr:tenascin X [Heterostelium album PN500]EFA74697.1 tenascin X [Heterostelium album PN500]|eukprot:XP_020426831.1 tenascin X [Heterostelium album PN500]